MKYQFSMSKVQQNFKNECAGRSPSIKFEKRGGRLITMMKQEMRYSGIQYQFSMSKVQLLV